MRVLFLEIKYAASKYVPDALLEMISTHKNDRVSIAATTLAQAGFPAVVVITVSSKYLVTLEYFGV